MSDGPYKSLPMNRAWKNLAKLAEIQASHIEEIREGVEAACSKDWSRLPKVFLKRLHALMMDNQATLREAKILQLKKLLRETAPTPFGQLVVDGCVRSIEDGNQGQESLQSAVSEAVPIWAERRGRQMEEHYANEGKAELGRQTGRRVRDVATQGDFSSFADDIINGRGQRKLKKQSGLDDGVPL